LLGPDTAPMSLELFVDRFADWVIEYNTVRVHSELGQTPPRFQDRRIADLQAQLADPETVRAATPGASAPVPADGGKG
jgi:transposase InsO family protein